MPLLRLSHLVAGLALAGVLAGVAAAGTIAQPPAVEASVASSHIVTSHSAVASGSITCTADAHFHLNAWIEQSAAGTLGKGSLPPKLPAKPSPAVSAHWQAVTACTGAAQPWSLTLAGVGAHPLAFTAGAVHYCLIAYVGKSHLYSLFAKCGVIALA